MLSVTVQAQFDYRVDNGTVTIAGYNGPGGAVTIPDTIEGRPVTTIGDSAFYRCTSLTSVTIPNGVTSIEPWAFYGCTGLTAIEVDGLNQAFSSLEGVLFNKSQTWLIACPWGKAGSYTIPNSVTSIGYYAFYGCTSLMRVYFEGNAPDALYPFCDWPATIYYLPGTTGWGATGGRPTLWRPQVQSSDAGFGVRTNGFGFNIAWAGNRVVVVEACADLANPTWSAVGTNTLTGGSAYFSDPDWANDPARFYRLRWP